MPRRWQEKSKQELHLGMTTLLCLVAFSPFLVSTTPLCQPSSANKSQSLFDICYGIEYLTFSSFTILQLSSLNPYHQHLFLLPSSGLQQLGAMGHRHHPTMILSQTYLLTTPQRMRWPLRKRRIIRLFLLSTRLYAQMYRTV